MAAARVTRAHQRVARRRACADGVAAASRTARLASASASRRVRRLRRRVGGATRRGCGDGWRRTPSTHAFHTAHGRRDGDARRRATRRPRPRRMGRHRAGSSDAARYEASDRSICLSPAPGDAGVGEPRTTTRAMTPGRRVRGGEDGVAGGASRRDRRGSFENVAHCPRRPRVGRRCRLRALAERLEVLARVARCTPVSTCGWAMATASPPRGHRFRLARRALRRCRRGAEHGEPTAAGVARQ